MNQLRASRASLFVVAIILTTIPLLAYGGEWRHVYYAPHCTKLSGSFYFDSYKRLICNDGGSYALASCGVLHDNGSTRIDLSESWTPILRSFLKTKKNT
jgi:hypothetical protein